MVIPESITSINDYAFYGCTNLTSITIPDSVASIGTEAFCGCTSLISMAIGNSVTLIDYGAFKNCTSIASIALPDSVTWIDRYVFEGCTSLTSINIPDGVTNIDYCAFYGCTSLTSITIPNSVTSIGWSAFHGCTSIKSVSIGNGITIIYSNTFKDCASLENITIPDSVTSIGESAFSGCSSLTSITIPDSVTNIGGAVFSGCSSLASITMPFVNSLSYMFGPMGDNYSIPVKTVIITSGNSIGRGAFSGCTNLTSITIPNSVTSIGSSAFEGCSALTSITIPDSVTSIGNSVFEGCTSLTSVTIPYSLTSIGESAFYCCKSLASITIPDSVTSIGKSAFYGCTGLKSVYISDLEMWCKMDFCNYSCNPMSNGADLYLNNNLVTELIIPESIIRINSYAFYGCKSFTNIMIPDSVTSIGASAFEGCSSLEKMVLPFIGRDIDADIEMWMYDNYFCGALGYIFGSYGSAYSSYPVINSYVPETLRQVIVTKDTTIASYAFYDCGNIETISLPAGVKSVGDYAFYDCKELTNLYFGGTKAEWEQIQFGSNWNFGANQYYLHYNAFEYGVYLPVECLKLPNSKIKYLLFPLGATSKIKVLDIKTGELIPLSETNIDIGVSSGNDKLSISSGYLSANKGGHATIAAYYVSNGKVIKLEEAMPMFVVESSNFEINNNMKFAAADREYISMCLDMYHSLYKINDIDEIVDINMNIIDGLLYGIDNLDEYLAGLLESDLPKEVAIKKALAEFIDAYVDDNYTHEMAVEDTETFLATLEAIHEIRSDYKKLTDLPSDIRKLIEKIDDARTLAALEKYGKGLSKDELKTLLDDLKQLTQYNEVWAEITGTPALKELNKTYKSCIKTIERIHSEKNLLDNWVGPSERVKIFWESTPGVIESGMMLVDSLIYGMSDYSHNIDILEKIHDKMLACGYKEDSAEIKAIRELKSEYHNKAVKAFADFVTNFASDTIVNIASKNPYISIARIASSIAMSLTQIDEKAEWLALENYLEPLERCNYSIKDLYLNGKIAADEEEVKLFASLYINMLLKLNNLAYDIGRLTPSVDTEQLSSIQKNISTLNSILQLYFK